MATCSNCRKSLMGIDYKLTIYNVKNKIGQTIYTFCDNCCEAFNCGIKFSTDNRTPTCKDHFETLKQVLPYNLHQELEKSEGDFHYHSQPYESSFLQKIVPILAKNSNSEYLSLLKTRSSDWDQHAIDHIILERDLVFKPLC